MYVHTDFLFCESNTFGFGELKLIIRITCKNYFRTLRMWQKVKKEQSKCIHNVGDGCDWPELTIIYCFEKNIYLSLLSP